MPMIWLAIPRAEYDAFRAVLTRAEQVDWAAYDRAKQHLLTPIEPPDELDTPDIAPIEADTPV